MTFTRSCYASDVPRFCEIYNHYIRETVATFEETPILAEEMSRRIDNVIPRFPWLVWAENGSVLGYAYAAPWHARSAYRFTVESTIYLAPEATGRGIGSKLYQALITELRARDIRCAIGAISFPNPASIALHEKLGFQKVGHFREVGWKFGRWVDVGYWQLIFEPSASRTR